MLSSISDSCLVYMLWGIPLCRYCEDLSSRQIHTTGPAGSWVNVCTFGQGCQRALQTCYIILDPTPWQGVSAYFPEPSPIVCAAQFLNFCYFARWEMQVTAVLIWTLFSYVFKSICRAFSETYLFMFLPFFLLGLGLLFFNSNIFPHFIICLLILFINLYKNHW